MKHKLINKPIKENYVRELLIQRGLAPSELDYFLNVPNDSELEDPALLDNIDQAWALFKIMMHASKDETIAVVVD